MPKLFILLCLLACATANAQKNADDIHLKNTLLWEITGPDQSTPSYLFGTMHLLCPEDAQLSDSLRYSIESTKQVYFEIDMDDMMETMSALKYLNMNDNIKLSDLLAPDEYKRVRTYLNTHK